MNMNVSLTNSSSFSQDFQDFSVISIFLISIHVINSFLGIPLNIYIIVLLFPSHGVMDASNVFSWNQAISNVFFMLFGPFHSLCLINVNLCFFKAFGFFFGIILPSQSLFQCCVCLERYLAVVHPLTFLRYKPLRFRVTCSIAVWVCSLATGISCSCIFPYVSYNIFLVIYCFDCGLFLLCINPEKAEASRPERYEQ